MTCRSCIYSIGLPSGEVACRLGYPVIRCIEFIYEPGADE